jgi:hypothetical protein
MLASKRQGSEKVDFGRRHRIQGTATTGEGVNKQAEGKVGLSASGTAHLKAK